MNLLDILNNNIGGVSGINIVYNNDTRSILVTHNNPDIISDVNLWFLDNLRLLNCSMPDYGYDSSGVDLGNFGIITDAWLIVYG
jgi:hypothetical protein